jgi:hypothetical protein
MNLLTFIAPLAVAATFMMPADAANHKELPALGNTHIQVFDKTPVFVPILSLIILLPMLTE